MRRRVANWVEGFPLAGWVRLALRAGWILGVLAVLAVLPLSSARGAVPRLPSAVPFIAQAAVPPDAPTGASATAGDASATVTWSPPASDGGSPITSYTVTSAPGGLTATTPDGGTTRAVVPGLTTGVSDTFTVTPTNGAGASAPSAPSNAVTPTGAPVPPGAPTGVTATAADGAATVDWLAPASNGGSPITAYTVTSSPGGVTATTPDGVTTSVVVGGLTNGVSYTFTVVATNVAGSSAPSAPSNAVTPSPSVTAPGSPTAVTATPGNAQASVTWTPPASNGGSAITSYTVTSSPGGVTVTTPDGATTSAVVPSLTNGVSYTFTVVATNAIGTSAPSAPSNAVTPTVVATVPGAPSGVVATAGNAQATVVWTAPASDGGSPILAYTVTSSPGGLTVTTPDGASTSAVVTGLTNGVSYTFTVVAINAVGTSAASAPSNAATPTGATAPGAPTGVTAIGGIGSATVSWLAPVSNGGSPITSYTVTSSPGGITATTSNGTTTSAVVPGLTDGITYTFTVVATNAIGTSVSSDPSEPVTPGPILSFALAPGPGQRGYYLRSADVLVGGVTFNQMTEALPVGPAALATASAAVRRIDVPFQDSAGLQIWASTPVPAGATWDIAGPMTFEAYVSGSGTIRDIALRAAVYRIATDGTTTTILTTARTALRDIGGTAALISWNATAPSTTLVSGERIGVRFYFYTDRDQPGLVARLHFEDPARDSGVVVTVSETAAPGQVRSSHYRVGRDTPFATPVWFANTDTPATSFEKSQSFQLRFAVYDDSAQSINWTPQLEWSTSPTSGFALMPTAPGGPFHVIDSPSYANGAVIPVAQFGTGTSPGTAVDGIAYDTSNPAPAPITLPGNSYSEVAFTVFVNSTPPDGQAYYFRLTNGGTPLTTYDAGPASIIIGFPLPPAPEAQPPAHNFHQPYSADTSACAACHRAHTSSAPTVLYKAWPEEAVCFTCHDGSAAPDILTQFNKTYVMPITATEGVHSKDEPRLKDPLAFSGANRHVECADCHNPHLAGQGNHQIGTNYAAGPQQGVWGIAVSNTAPWAAPTYSTVSPVTFQYQLCFKCHSSWAYGSNPPQSPSGGFPQTDQAKEFNTLNPAYHPVEDVGKNPFLRANGTSYASSLIGGFTPTSRMVCSDCHMSETAGQVAGPHGSTQPFILRGQWDRTTGQNGTQNHLCFTCHAYSTYGPGANGPTGFSDTGGTNLHGVMVGARNKAFNDAPIVCMDCHVAIVHGYQRDHLLGFTGDGAPYINRPYSGGLVQIDQWRASGQWVFDSCDTAMNSCK